MLLFGINLPIPTRTCIRKCLHCFAPEERDLSATGHIHIVLCILLDSGLVVKPFHPLGGNLTADPPPFSFF